MAGLFGIFGKSQAADDEASATRMQAWEKGLKTGPLPDFVLSRLSDAAQGKRPWMATMTPAELLVAKSHGLKPLATVSGTCWYQYDRSWTDGHLEGWNIASQRMVEEAVACGANAVIDVRLRTAGEGRGGNMDFSLVGTAVRLEGLPANPEPIICTTTAMEFVRLLEMNIVPCGIAIGTSHQSVQASLSPQAYGGANANSLLVQASGFANGRLNTLSEFWEKLRRSAYWNLKRHAAYQGNGVLAHTRFEQLIRTAEGEKGAPSTFLGRHIVIGTVVDTPKNARVPHGITTVIDMRDDLSPLNKASVPDHSVYGTNQRESVI